MLACCCFCIGKMFKNIKYIEALVWNLSSLWHYLFTCNSYLRLFLTPSKGQTTSKATTAQSISLHSFAPFSVSTSNLNAKKLLVHRYKITCWPESFTGIGNVHSLEAFVKWVYQANNVKLSIFNSSVLIRFDTTLFFFGVWAFILWDFELKVCQRRNYADQSYYTN